MSEIRVTTISDTAGTGPVTLTKQYASKAWVNFNGTGTVAIRGSGNVGSVTDNGTGDYTLNFTSAMADANYSVVCGDIINRQSSSSRLEGTNTRTATQCQVYGTDPASAEDFPYMEFVMNGDLA